MLKLKNSVADTDLFRQKPLLSSIHLCKVPLTKLWKHIVTTKSLPDGLNETELFHELRERLRDPEREVRLYALRMLCDLIPVTTAVTLDANMRAVLPELLGNLAHSAPALRRGALDTLRVYLFNTKIYEQLVKEIVHSEAEETIIEAVPHFIKAKASDAVVDYIINRLWDETVINSSRHQDLAVQSLLKVKSVVGDEKFTKLLGKSRVEKYQKMCDTFGLPSDCEDLENCDVNRNFWGTEEPGEDKVILETEITLKAGPAITMKIHEEGRVARESSMDSEEDACGRAGLVKILADDSESDSFEIDARRTPRKVRFGGEDVKMRTPETDSSNQEEDGTSNHLTTIHITVTDAVSIRTARSLIPVRITSLPSTPHKTRTVQVPKRLHVSTPDIFHQRRHHLSKIPRKMSLSSSMNASKQRTEKGKNSSEPKTEAVRQSTSRTSNLRVNNCVRRGSRGDDVFSPIPVHNEIEVFHNLTRSPDREKKHSVAKHPVPENNGSVEPNNSEQQNPSTSQKSLVQYNSFKVCYHNDNNHNTSQHNADEKEKSVSENAPSTSKIQGASDFHQQLQVTAASKEDEMQAKGEALNNLIKVLKQASTYETLESESATLLIEALLACQRREKLRRRAEEALELLVKGLRPDVLDQSLHRLAPGLAKMCTPKGICLALVIMEKCSARKVLSEVRERATGHRTREGALQIVMAAARILPSKDIDINECIAFAVTGLKDRRRRVRQAALETLATLAHISSNAHILDLVSKNTQGCPDQHYLMQVLRIRLSRRQLPSVEMNGTVRYSSPTDQTEVEWLAGSLAHSSSQSSSSSSATVSVNYWKHNSRHEEQVQSDLIIQSYGRQEIEEGEISNQIWAVDSSLFSENKDKEGSPITVGSTKKIQMLRPVFILQPDVKGVLTVKGEKGHRRYDRGRSFSPPKHLNQQAANRNSAPLDNLSSSKTHAHSPLRHNSFRKSFSSEHLYYSEKQTQQDIHFPLSFSSRSSTTSTASSTKSGVWHREFRSGIPVPVTSDTKLRFRGNINNNIAVNTSGPLIARRKTVLTPSDSPVNEKFEKSVSTHKSPDAEVIRVGLPAHSSDSESSGYFTPPPDSNHAFIKLDTEEHLSEVSIDADTTDNCDRTAVTSFTANTQPQIIDSTLLYQRQISVSSVETNDGEQLLNVAGVEISEDVVNVAEVGNIPSISRRDTSSSLGEAKSMPALPSDSISKSKSVVNLNTTVLPDINSTRKNTNSAPPLNIENFNINIINNNYEAPCDPSHNTTQTLLPGSLEYTVDVSPPISKECTSSRKLSRRAQEKTPQKSSGSGGNVICENGLRPFSKPKEGLQQALMQMESNEWEVIVKGLKGLMRVTRYHPETVEAHIHAICVSLAKQVKNLRSQVSRAACQAAKELFASCKRSLDMEVEELAGPLLQRTADTNRFLRADANSALDEMCEQLSAGRVISVICSRGCTHQNAIVRAASARLLSDIVNRLGVDRTFQLPREIRERVLLAAANGLTDGSLDVRKHTKALLSLLVNHPIFHKTLLDAVPQHTLRHIAKTLSTIKSPNIT